MSSSFKLVKGVVMRRLLAVCCSLQTNLALVVITLTDRPYCLSSTSLFAARYLLHHPHTTVLPDTTSMVGADNF